MCTFYFTPDGMNTLLSDRSWIDGFYLRNTSKHKPGPENWSAADGPQVIHHLSLKQMGLFFTGYLSSFLLSDASDLLPTDGDDVTTEDTACHCGAAESCRQLSSSSSESRTQSLHDGAFRPDTTTLPGPRVIVYHTVKKAGRISPFLSSCQMCYVNYSWWADCHL